MRRKIGKWIYGVCDYLKWIFNVRNWWGKKIHQSWGVMALAVGVIAGAVIGTVGRVRWFDSGIWILFAVVIFVIMYLKPRIWSMFLVGVTGMILGFFRVGLELKGADYIGELVGKTVVVSGVVSGDPVTDEKGTKVKLTGLKFGENGEYESAGSLYATLRKNEEIRRSDVLVLSGKMSEGFGSYAGYMYQPAIVKRMVPEPGDAVLQVRDFFAGRVEQEIPERQVKLGLSYLLGMKAGLDDELSEQLRVVGLTHIVVASGAHLSILVEVARKIFGKMSRFAGLLFSVIFIVFFMAMVGWTPSIMRAGVMAILTLVGWYVGRKVKPFRMILMVAAGTLMVNPMFLIDLGWMLSFASYAGIMLVGPGIQKFFYGEKKPGLIGGTVLTTVAATVMTLPVVLYYYGQISLISVAANLLILPTLSWAMGAVFLTGVAAGIPFVSVAVGWVATRLLDFHILVVGFFGEMRQFLVKMEVGQPQVFLIYLPIMVGLIWQKVVKLREVNRLE